MSPQDVGADDGAEKDLLAPIAAVARGELSREEAVALLRRDGVDALDVLVSVLARAASQKGAAWEVSEPISPTRSHQQGPQTGGNHRVPRLPVLLNGTLYDPADIVLFDGTALHFVPARDHLLAVDDLELMHQWWRTTYLTAAAEKYQYGGYHAGGIEPAWQPAPFPPMEPGGELPGSQQGNPIPSLQYPDPDAGPETRLYEHAGRQGGYLTLPGNRGFYDLTKISKGFLGLEGDWNDTISSVWMHKTSYCVLHEHVHYGGSSLSIWGGMTYLQGHLEDVGWNDRASSVETW